MKFFQRQRQTFLEQDEKTREMTVNRSYQGFYADHTDYYVPPKDGRRGRVVHVFTGEWRRIKGDEGAFRRRKWVYALLFMLGAVFFLFAASRPVSAYRQRAVGILQFADILSFGWTLIDLISYWLAKYRMTTYMFKSIELLRAAAALTAVAVWLTAALTAAYAVIQGDGVGPQTAFSLAAFAASGTALFVLSRMETRAEYVAEESTEIPPVGGVRIQ